jgi:hypothetical protein
VGVDDTPSDELEDVPLTLDYQQLDSTGTVIADLGSDAPSAPGSYQVTADFAGSTDYQAASASASFSITTPPLTAPLLTDASFSASTLGPSDDGSSTAVDLGFSLTFGGQSYAQVYVNNNGNLTFGAALGQYTPSALNDLGVPIIAPFFADVDTRNSPPVTYGTGTVDGHAAFAATWNHVGFYSQQTDHTNTFQVVLISRPDLGAGAFQIEFNYSQITWETGGASGGSDGQGGTPAVAGYSDGSGAANSYFQLLGSGSSGAFLDSNLITGLINNSANSSVTGRYIYTIS